MKNISLEIWDQIHIGLLFQIERRVSEEEYLKKIGWKCIDKCGHRCVDRYEIGC